MVALIRKSVCSSCTLQTHGAYIYDLFAVAAQLMLATDFAIIGRGIANNIGLINLSNYKYIAEQLAIYSTFKIGVLLSSFISHIS